MNTILNQAVTRTKEVAGEYWESVLAQRLHNNNSRAGSFFTKYNSVEELEAALLNANWSVYEGSLEGGKVILHTNDFEGKDGVLEKEKVNSEIFHINPKQIEGREEYATYVESDSELPLTTDTWLIISTYNPSTQSVNPDEPFILTLFPGLLLGPEDTVVNKGEYVKLVLKK